MTDEVASSALTIPRVKTVYAVVPCDASVLTNNVDEVWIPVTTAAWPASKRVQQD